MKKLEEQLDEIYKDADEEGEGEDEEEGEEEGGFFDSNITDYVSKMRGQKHQRLRRQIEKFNYVASKFIREINQYSNESNRMRQQFDTLSKTLQSLSAQENSLNTTEGRLKLKEVIVNLKEIESLLELPSFAFGRAIFRIRDLVHNILDEITNLFMTNDKEMGEQKDINKKVSEQLDEQKVINKKASEDMINVLARLDKIEAERNWEKYCLPVMRETFILISTKFSDDCYSKIKGGDNKKNIKPLKIEKSNDAGKLGMTVFTNCAISGEDNGITVTKEEQVELEKVCKSWIDDTGGRYNNLSDWLSFSKKIGIAKKSHSEEIHKLPLRIVKKIVGKKKEDEVADKEVTQFQSYADVYLKTYANEDEKEFYTLFVDACEILKAREAKISKEENVIL